MSFSNTSMDSYTYWNGKNLTCNHRFAIKVRGALVCRDCCAPIDLLSPAWQGLCSEDIEQLPDLPEWPPGGPNEVAEVTQ